MPWIEIIIAILLLIIVIFQILNYIKISKQNLDETENKLIQKFESINENLEDNIEDEFKRNREETLQNSKLVREEVGNSVRLLGDQLSNRIKDISDRQKDQLELVETRLKSLTQSNEEKSDKLKDQVSKQLTEIQEKNEKKLEEMRITVDEKLHSTLEKRLGESFKLVSDRLELVHKGLGEMQTLATGVGDLKKVLTNVKDRGTWGEIQLGNLLEQILTKEQYSQNVKTKEGSNALVEFAIKLPGKNSMKEDIVWLPIDAKFPLEDYQRLIEAREKVDLPMIAESIKKLERSVKEAAKDISTKYLDPPHTTDFAFMFLPIESLYAEVLSIPGLSDSIQREHKVTIAGPTNFVAVLNSLQMGFKTLAIEKRSSEVWKLLSIVKTEFSKFGDILDNTQKKLDLASKSIGDASRKTRTIERRLRDVHELPTDENQIELLDE
ncbi:MAG: DNA recombination protein RmuC [Ignavibacteriales bacterium]|nr:DNA recombination protein RmuC [Ignavibacteriota bacterium]MCB9247958.1 DNA recombination protein RmuC [Ignavibacteriales bacterium]